MSHTLKTTAVVLTDAVKPEACCNRRKKQGTFTSFLKMKNVIKTYKNTWHHVLLENLAGEPGCTCSEYSIAVALALVKSAILANTLSL